MSNWGITLTGVDEYTDLPELEDFLSPEVELGFLFTNTPNGRNRYPSRAWLAKTLGGLHGKCMVALHICGGQARQLLKEGKLSDLVRHVGRIQVNGNLSFNGVEDICNLYYTHDVITQHLLDNAHLLNATASNHLILVDDSGGRGISPVEWICPDTSKIVGFAGGLGPENLEVQYSRIRAICSNQFGWIDIEGKLRDENDHFSVEKVGLAIEAFQKVEHTL